MASKNTSLLPLFEQNIDKIHWDFLCECATPEIINFIEKHVDLLWSDCWKFLSRNPNAIPLLRKYPEKIQWNQLSQNPSAIPLLEHPEKIDWPNLSANPNACHLLFPLDLAQMKENNQAFKEELIAYVFEPERLLRLSKKSCIDLRNYLQMY